MDIRVSLDCERHDGRTGMKVDHCPLPRVLVIGSSGAGKSAFANRLAAKLDCPRVELDELYWGPNWTPKPHGEFRQLVADATSSERWVVDGNYSNVRDLLWPHARLVIWLNYGFAVVSWRSVRRTVARCVTRQELWHGNRESVARSFASRESILLWVATTFRRRREEFRLLRASGDYPNLAWIEFTRPAQADMWLQSIEPPMRASVLRTRCDGGETRGI